MGEALLYPWLVRGMVACALVSFTLLRYLSAPYGRHARAGWGPTIANRVGWVLMESPAVVVFLFIYMLGRGRSDIASQVLAAMWTLHYLYRAFLYPLRLPGPGRPVPILVVVLGAGFNVVNGYLNARWISEMHRYEDAWLTTPTFVFGSLLFVAGWAMNQHADGRLLALRKPGETGYRVPRGGLFRWVSCPNYLGEIIEWLGYALAAWSPAGLAFALYTAANLVPRALSHHEWYLRTFRDYPRDRKAIVPGIL